MVDSWHVCALPELLLMLNNCQFFQNFVQAPSQQPYYGYLSFEIEETSIFFNNTVELNILMLFTVLEDRHSDCITKKILYDTKTKI